MLPIVHFLGKDVSTYSIMAVLGLLVCGVVISFLAKKKGIRFENIILSLVSAMGGLLIGSHLLYGIVNYQIVFKVVEGIGQHSFQEIISGLAYAFGGAVFYGGFLGGIFGIFVFLKLEKKTEYRDMFDLYAIAVPLFHTFGRVGCFLAGCCYGVESELGIMAHGNHLSHAVNDVNRFPVQLVEAGLNLILFFMLIYIDRQMQKKGKMLFVYMVSYPIYRFILEFFRGDVNRGLWYGLSTSQWISLALLITGIIGLIIMNRKKSKTALVSPVI